MTITMEIKKIVAELVIIGDKGTYHNLYTAFCCLIPSIIEGNVEVHYK
jgi:hypothetical protein